MTTDHVDDRLLPFLRGELPEGERRVVELHLVGCPACRGARADVAAIATALSIAEPPPVDWKAFRTELRERLERRPGPARPDVPWWRLSVPAALAAGLVAALLYAGVWHSPTGDLGPEQVVLEQVALAERLGLIARFRLVERLDLLEDFDVIDRLDGEPVHGES
jgi:anti-sigma factor RsiW